jgi:Protein of unknown function (DUF3592)
MGRVLYALGGLVFLAMAASTALAPGRDRRQRARAVPAVGRVVDMEVREYDEGGRSYHPVVEFTAGPDDRLVTATAWVPENVGERLTTGRRVAIRYDAKTPTKVWIEGHETSGSVFGVLFMLLLAVGMFCQAVR